MEALGITTVLGVIVDQINFINNWLGVEIELMLPVMVLVALIDLITDGLFKKKNTADRLILVCAFALGMLLQFAFGESESLMAGIKGALYLGSVSAVVHYFLRDYIFAFFIDFVPWLFKTLQTVVRRKVALLLGVKLEETLLDDDKEEEDVGQ